MILSGMSSLQQMKENIATFETSEPLTDAEEKVLSDIAEGMKNALPCTSCRYCCAGCPMQLDIPTLMSMSNDMAVQSSFNTVARYTALGPGKQASDCISCGQCMQACPQMIDVPTEMERLAALMAGQKTWEEICAERAAVAEAMKKQGKA